MATPPRPRSVQELWRNTANNRITILILERDNSTIVPTYWTALVHSNTVNPMAGVASPIHVSKSIATNLDQAGLRSCNIVLYVNEDDLRGLTMPPNVRATFFLERIFARNTATDRFRFTSYEVMVKEALTTRLHNLGSCTPYVWAEIIRHPRAVPNIFLLLATHLPRPMFQWNAVMCMDILYRDLTRPVDLPYHLGSPTFANNTQSVAVIGSPNLRSDLNFPHVVWSRVMQMSQQARGPCTLPPTHAQNILGQVGIPNPLPRFIIAPNPPLIRPFAAGAPAAVIPGLNLTLRLRGEPQPQYSGISATPVAVDDPTPGPSRPNLLPRSDSPSILTPRLQVVEPYDPEHPGPSRPSEATTTTCSGDSDYQMLVDSSDSEEEEGEIRDDVPVQQPTRNEQNRGQPGLGFNPYNIDPATLRPANFRRDPTPANIRQNALRPGVFRPMGLNRQRFIHPYHPFRDTQRLCFNCWRRGHMRFECPRPLRNNAWISRPF